MSLNTMVRTSSDLENYIIAVERIDEYANLETEVDIPHTATSHTHTHATTLCGNL